MHEGEEAKGDGVGIEGSVAMSEGSGKIAGASEVSLKGGREEEAKRARVTKGTGESGGCNAGIFEAKRKQTDAKVSGGGEDGICRERTGMEGGGKGG
jgi:hypothetical protein